MGSGRTRALNDADLDALIGAVLCAIVLAPAESIPVEARRARVRERVQKRRDRTKPRAAAATGGR